MPEQGGTSRQKKGGMSGQEQNTGVNSKKGREGNRRAGEKNTEEPSMTSLSGHDNPNLITDHDAIEIFNKILRKNKRGD